MQTAAGCVNRFWRSALAGKRRPIRLACAALLALAVGLPALGADATKSEYRGWESLRLANGLVEVQVVPAVGGRVMQFKLGPFEYLWVNPQLAGKQPTPTGLGPDGAWLNYGGDKLWPAPQGWDNDQQWPGPPDGVLDGSPHEASIIEASGKSTNAAASGSRASSAWPTAPPA
jgi:hypothetical protein